MFKVGNTSIANGITDSLLEKIKAIPGVADINYSYFETERNWTWNGMNYDQMGIERYDSLSNMQNGSNARYLYATEYVEPSEEIYEIISRYMDTEYIDYEAFARGEQVLIIEDANSSGRYDASMKTGVDLSLMNYSNPFIELNSYYLTKDFWSSYYSRIYRYVQDNMIDESMRDEVVLRRGSEDVYMLLDVASEYFKKDITKVKMLIMN